MTIDREIDCTGAIHDSIKLTADESVALDKCHGILRERFEQMGEPYDRARKEMCEWWLLGLLRFEGAEKMADMAKNAPFQEKQP